MKYIYARTILKKYIPLRKWRVRLWPSYFLKDVMILTNGKYVVLHSYLLMAYSVTIEEERSNTDGQKSLLNVVSHNILFFQNRLYSLVFIITS